MIGTGGRKRRGRSGKVRKRKVDVREWEGGCQGKGRWMSGKRKVDVREEDEE